jgi:hypothetical protein
MVSYPPYVILSYLWYLILLMVSDLAYGIISYLSFFSAQSCPPVRVYSSDKLDQQLTMAATSFCSQEIKVTEDGKVARERARERQRATVFATTSHFHPMHIYVCVCRCVFKQCQQRLEDD